ncbi:DUF1674 domain-containing protein [Hyphomicrobium sp. 99]|uniref:DUF1674 domain-containing protein n=1 Tax=Hyphomicrobium sp. 99 TaxID=1163419 RepID=UPI0005F76FDA|nr:DUF1674 domain-containing protein [Hyphomicrobium sp. 99]
MTAEDRTGDDGSGDKGSAEAQSHSTTPRVLTPEARRALAEAEERRQKIAAEPKAPRELGGREGPEPTRFGDWEKGGITSDF